MLGKPGSGKGTVGKMLSDLLGIIHVSSGELFRNYIKRAGKIGEEIESYVASGKLVPDDLAIKLVEKRLLEDDCKKGVILDGFPRTVLQAEELDRFLISQKEKINVAVELELSDENIIDRILKRKECSNSKCREVYNLDFKRPKVADICDVCGSKLITRQDDNIETVKQRLKTYHEVSANLIGYYKEQDLLYTVKPNLNSPDTSKIIVEEVNEYLKREHL